MKDSLNTVLGDIKDVHHRFWSGVAGVYEDPELKSSSCNNNREQTVARGSSTHMVCVTTCIDIIWWHLELSSYANSKCGWATPNISALTTTYYAFCI